MLRHRTLGWEWRGGGGGGNRVQSPSFFLSFFAMKTHWPAGWLSRSGVALALGREISVQRRAKKRETEPDLALRCAAALGTSSYILELDLC